LRKIKVETDLFKFDDFAQAILNFHEGIGENIHASAHILTVDSEGNGEWGPDEGWDNFLEVLENGDRLYFPFIIPAFDQPVSCANGEEVELGEDPEINLGETDTVGYLMAKENNKFVIESAHCEGGGPPFGEYIYPEDCGEFDKAMNQFIKGFLIPNHHKKKSKSKGTSAK
jgi:hypothetical protein